eukprot:6490236-Amphidinium_carterae.2
MQASQHQSFPPWLGGRLRQHTLWGGGRQQGSIGVGRNTHIPITHERWILGHYTSHARIGVHGGYVWSTGLES